MGFNIDQYAKITNLNIRREHHGDDTAVAIDVHIEIENMKVTAAAPLFGAQGAAAVKQLKASFWDKDGDPHWPAVTQIKLMTEFEAGHRLRKIAGLAESAVIDSMKGFAVLPRGHHEMNVRFKLSIVEPTEALVDAVAHGLGDHNPLRIEADPDLLDEQQEDAA